MANPFEGNSSFGGSGSNPLFAGVWDVLGPDIERRRATEQSIQDTKVKALLEKLWTTPGITPEEEEATLQEALSVYKGNKSLKDMIQQMHDTHKAFMPVMDKMNPGLRSSNQPLPESKPNIMGVPPPPIPPAGLPSEPPVASYGFGKSTENAVNQVPGALPEGVSMNMTMPTPQASTFMPPPPPPTTPAAPVSPLLSARAKMHPDPVAQAEAVRRQQQLDEETKYNREQAGRVQIAGMQKPDQSVMPFDVWRQQNPNAPISEWIALTDTTKGSTPGFTDEVITVDGKGPVAAVRQGNEYFVPNTNPPQKIKGAIGPYEKPDKETGGGLSLPVMSRVDAIAARFEKGETVKIYNDLGTRKQLMMDIINDPRGPSGPGDLAVVYEFMKALDPSSVVRESERKDAENSGNIFSGVWAKFNGLFNPSGGSLSPQAKQDFLKTIGRRLSYVEQQYANEYKETLRKINNVTGGKNGADYVTDFDIGLGRDIVAPATATSDTPAPSGNNTGKSHVKRKSDGSTGYVTLTDANRDQYEVIP